MLNIKTILVTQLKQRPWAIVIAIVAFVYLILNIILVGGNPDLISNINVVLNPILATTVTSVSFLLTRKMGRDNSNNQLWTGLSIGWACWALAELLYAIPVFTGQETSYPSAADIFWLLGYLPMFYSFLQRQRALPVELSRNNKIISWVIATVVIGFTGYFILIPILKAFDPAYAVESILNLLYPLLDLILLLLVLRIFFAYVQGTYGQARLWVAIGFTVMTISDLMYCYLTGIDRYYPDGQATFMSVFVVDYTYTLAYLFFLLGLIILRRVASFSSSFIKARESAGNQ